MLPAKGWRLPIAMRHAQRTPRQSDWQDVSRPKSRVQHSALDAAIHDAGRPPGDGNHDLRCMGPAELVANTNLSFGRNRYLRRRESTDVPMGCSVVLTRVQAVFGVARGQPSSTRRSRAGSSGSLCGVLGQAVAETSEWEAASDAGIRARTARPCRVPLDRAERPARQFRRREPTKTARNGVMTGSRPSLWVCSWTRRRRGCQPPSVGCGWASVVRWQHDDQGGVAVSGVRPDRFVA
jgi:hypothetical protein